MNKEQNKVDTCQGKQLERVHSNNQSEDMPWWHLEFHHTQQKAYDWREFLISE